MRSFHTILASKFVRRTGRRLGLITLAALPLVPVASAFADEVLPSAAPSAKALSFEPLTPVRLVDTREDLGASRLIGQSSARIQLAGEATLPAGADAISANFTVTGSAEAGYLTVWNCSDERPVVSTVNFGAGETVPNGANVPLDDKGGICVFSPVGVDLVVDVSGYYGPNGRVQFGPLAPVRLMDSREGGVGRLRGHEVRALQVTGVGGVPVGAKAVVLNITSVNPGVEGYVTVYPCDQPQPLAAALNPRPGDIRSNLVISAVSSKGQVCLFTSGDVDLVVDATGYFSKTGASFTTTAPFRFADTREADDQLNAGTGGHVVGAGETVVLQIPGERGVSASAKVVAVNIAVTDARSAGFLTVFPCGVRPATSTVNFAGSNAVSAGAIVHVSAAGELCLFVSAAAHVVVDVNGWWKLPANMALPTTPAPTAPAVPQAAAVPGEGGKPAVPADGQGYLGSSLFQTNGETKAQSLTRTESLFQRQLAITHYFLTGTQWPTAELQDDVTNGRYPLISWKVGSWASVAAGQNDAAIATFARQVAALGGPVFFSYWHEPTNDAGAAADYVAAWRRVHDIFQAEGATNAAFTWIMIAYDLRAAFPADSWYPGESYVDWVGADAYNWAPQRPGTTWTDLQQVSQHALAYSKKVNKPMMLAETGTNENTGAGPTKAEWFANAQAWLENEPNVKALVYFNNVHGNSSGANSFVNDWQIDTSASSLAAWRSLSTSPRWAFRGA
jgi:hypothetical protein